jgi:predicted protein tyrosine phosphatase
MSTVTVSEKRILFVCEGNLHRSPTAEQLYSFTPGLKVRSAGLSPLARTQVTDELVEWFDAIFIMEKRLLRMILRRFESSITRKAVVCLDVPDDFQFQQSELIAVLTDRLTPHLGAPHPRPGSH